MAEILPDALSWLDAKKRQAIAELATGLSSGDTFTDVVMNAVKDLARNLTGGALFATPEQRQLVEDRGSVMPEVSRPAIRDAVASAAQGFGVGPLGVGALRAAGRQDLMPSHGTPMESLLSNGKLLPELYSPSIAIQRDTLANPFSRFTLIPKLGAFDPQYMGNTQLFNRDAYIARRGDYKGRPANYGFDGVYSESNDVVGRAKAIAAARNWDRFEAAPPAGSEGRGWDAWPDITNPQMHNVTHQASLMEAPNFRSFAAYEKSPAGADTLQEGFSNVSAWSKEFQSRLRNLLERAGVMDEGAGQLPEWNELSKNFLMFLKDPQLAGETQKILASAQRAPSEYGELKVSGAAPLTSDLWAGALWDPQQSSPSLSRLFQSEMAKRGLAIHPVSENTTPTEMFRAADLLQKFAGPAKGGSTAGWEGVQKVTLPELPVPKPERVESAPYTPKDLSFTLSVPPTKPISGLEEAAKSAIKGFKPEGESSFVDFSFEGKDYWAAPESGNVFTSDTHKFVTQVK